MANAQGLDKPVKLSVTISVLDRTEGMGDTFQGVYKGTCKVVGGINLPFRSEG